MEIPEGKNKIYFVSDLHLGMYPYDKSRAREKLFVKWLDEKMKDASAFYLLGDIFDYWWEYKKVIPRGFTRFLGKIAEITDSGIPVHIFSGNHDVWIFDYLPSELGVTVHHKPYQFSEKGKKFFIAHGDGLGPGDRGYKFLKKAFRSKILQWMFARLHPNFALALAHAWSKKSRYAKGLVEEFKGEEQEYLLQYSKEIVKNEHSDYFIFGHRHLALDLPVNDSARYINVGDWVTFYSYAEFDGQNLHLKYFKDECDFKEGFEKLM
ncbi:MAG: UDP-2,3-diacylglucosamine diphosphatase [Bacteroidales bacterium]|nr:UDP-2,3-diacylglucosamine diphosphatase [Bacteroidales bacterium]